MRKANCTVFGKLKTILGIVALCVSMTGQVMAADDTEPVMDENLREIVLDLETTGRSARKGDRIVEIGAVELINHKPTGKTFHQYINLERKVSKGAVKVHGLTNEFLADKPTFKEIAQQWVDFVGENSVLVAHNAPFDVRFINNELKAAGYKEYESERVIDTLALARSKFSVDLYRLDYLCQCFNVDNSERTLHGALLDAQLLVEVYSALLNEAPKMCPADIIRQAIAENKKLEIVYVNREGEKTTKTIVPYKMEYGKVLKTEGGGNLINNMYYIMAYCELDKDNRMFRLDRFKQVKILP